MDLRLREDRDTLVVNQPCAKMPSYRIIGTDLKEYGPVSAEQIRQWIVEGRVNSRTKLQAEGGGEWKRLSEVPELAAALPGAGPPPEEMTPFQEGAKEAGKQGAEACPNCGSRNVRRGKLMREGKSPVIFRPEGMRFLDSFLVRRSALVLERQFRVFGLRAALGLPAAR